MQRTRTTLLAWLSAATLGLCVALATMTAHPNTAIAQSKGDIKLAYVDLQRALNEVEDGKKAKKRLKAMFTKRQKELDAKQKELEALKKELEKKYSNGDYAEDVVRKDMMDYQQKHHGLQTLYAKLQKELAEAESKETEKIFAKMRDILKEIGPAEGYTMVLEKTESSVLWAPNSLVITDLLIQRYNSGG